MIIINKGKTVVVGYVQDLLNSAELKVTFEVDDLDSAKHLISTSRWDDKVESFTKNKLIFNLSPEEIAVINKLIFNLPSEEIAALNEYFIFNDISVSAVIPTRSLEEYFLKITEDVV
jgi:ABC-type multidrug transport system ATPase subunit